MLGLQSHRLDFEILPTTSSKKIIFLDTSDYYEKPESPLLQVNLPGYSKYFLVPIESGRINTFNSHTLGFTTILLDDEPLEFPDGIYKFVYKVCPYATLHITKHFLRTNKLDKELAQIYSKLDCVETNSCYKKELLDIHVLLESAKANTTFNYIDKANKDFSLAQKKVSKLLNTVLENGL